MSDLPDCEGYKVRYAIAGEAIENRQKQGCLALSIKQGSALLARLILWRYMHLLDLLAKQQKR